jgi:pimeloyl-ACP methyl ester carboxylesterase
MWVMFLTVLTQAQDAIRGRFAALVLGLLLAAGMPAYDLCAQVAAPASKPQKVVVLLPGFMGSNLWLCEELNPDNCDTLIWDADKFIANKKVLANMNALVRGKSTSFLTYGKITKYAKDKGFKVLTFPYDWRRSNETSAADLHDFLCKTVTKNSNVHLYFLAHSMGGLVLKTWLMSFLPHGCPGTETKPQVERIAFVATPHLGAVDTVNSLLNGKDMKKGMGFWSRTGEWFLSWFNRQVDERVSGLDSFSYTIDDTTIYFESVFELLPVTAAQCANDIINGIKSRDKYAPKITFAVSTTDAAWNDPKNDAGFVDLFDTETWDKLYLLRRISDKGGVLEIIKNYLTKAFSIAAEKTCLLAKFNPADAMPGNDRIHYIAGTGIPTISRIRFNGEEFKADDSLEGDGTVLTASAYDLLHSSATNRIEVTADHIGIMNHQAVRDEIERWSKD